MSIQERVQNAMRELDRQKNDVVDAFLISGAMMRDLCGEVGSPEWVQVGAEEWELQQDFRIL